MRMRKAMFNINAVRPRGNNGVSCYLVAVRLS